MSESQPSLIFLKRERERERERESRTTLDTTTELLGGDENTSNVYV